MNIANQVTLSRAILAFVCMGLLAVNTFSYIMAAFIVFIVAAITDFFDGYLARKYNLVSDWGKLWDPIADKILVIGVFLAFVFLGVVELWMVMVIIFREVVVTWMRMICLKKGTVIEAKMAGKHKTVAQIVGIILIFIMLLIMKHTPDTVLVKALTAYIGFVVYYYYYIVFRDFIFLG
jgi:CDP-diacylglycerol--glycerol-3-phosphate 3-phosphatidyltransferase